MTTEDMDTKGKQTRESIRVAIVRLEKGRPKVVEKGRKLTIAAAAEEAGVSRATIHNRYPDLAERIREYGNKAVRQQRDEKQEVLKTEKEKNRTLRGELAELRVTLARVTSENAALILRNRQVEAINSSKNVTMMPLKKDT
jgi:AcrR family transcriptional regulator